MADDAGLVPLAIDHADQAVRAELARVFSAPHTLDDSPWHDLDRVFLDEHPLRDSLSVPMLARTATIGVLSLGRFGSDAPPFTDTIASSPMIWPRASGWPSKTRDCTSMPAAPSSCATPF